MENKETARNLSSLVQLDIAAVRAHGQALEKIDRPLIREHLLRYRDDHSRHIDELSREIRRLGFSPPTGEHTDFKSFFIQEFTSLRSVSGIQGALKAIHTNEKMTHHQYEKAQTWNLNAHARDLVRRAFEDEQRHLNYLQKVLEEKAWEKPGPEKEIAGA